MALGQLDLTGPLRTIVAMQQESARNARETAESQQRLSEGQLNLKKLQMAIDESTREQKENEQIRGILSQGGTADEVYQKLLPINPDKARTYLNNARADEAAKRAEAIANYNLNPAPITPMESVPQPPATVAAPQPQMAPIPTNLAGQPSTVSQPAAPVPILRNVQLPNRWQMAPAPNVTIPSATGGAPLIIPGQNREQAIAAAHAEEAYKSMLKAQEEQNKPLIVPEGGLARIPSLTGGPPTIIEGAPKLLEIEKEAAPWLAKNPGKTLDDYVKYKQASSVPHDPFQETYLPAYLRQHGITENSTQDQKDAMTLQADKDYKNIAKDPVMQEILRSNAANARIDRSYLLADTQLKEIRKPIDSESANIAQAKSLLSQNNPGANSLVAPAIIKAVVGGMGSGVRITTPEMKAVNQGRGQIANFESWLSSWSLDPSKYQALLPEQKVWLNGVLDKIAEKVQAKQSAISKANQDLIEAEDVKTHRQTMKDLNDKLESIDSGGATGLKDAVERLTKPKF
jgi:hypothetical protein